MLNCRDTSRIISESFDRKLPVWTRVGLRLHLWMCKLCRSYKETMTLVEAEVKRQAQEGGEESPTSAKLTDAAKERLEASLR